MVNTIEVPSKILEWDIAVELTPIALARESIKQQECEEVGHGTVARSPYLQPLPEPGIDRKLTPPYASRCREALGNFHFTPCCAVCGIVLVESAHATRHFAVCHFCHTLTCEACWSNGYGCVHIEPCSVVHDEMDVEGGVPKALPPTLRLYRRHPMSQAGRLGLASNIHVFRAPFPSVCPACTCTFKPCSSHGHPRQLVCYLCTWIM